MAVFEIQKGKNIKLKGEAKKEIVSLALPKHISISPLDFRGPKFRTSVKVGDIVKQGSAVLHDKNHPEIIVASPISGKVTAINRGDKRALLEVIIEADGRNEVEIHQSYSDKEISSLLPDTVIKYLLQGGLWPVIRQRPFSIVAHTTIKPKSIFIHAMNTEPLAADVDFILEGQEKEFQIGLDIIKKLTSGAVHLCVDKNAKSKALTQAQNVNIHQFVGAHPTGNVSTHIHHIDPVTKHEAVWYIEAQDVLRIAKLFLHGIYSPERIVAVTGEGTKNKIYAKTIVGVPLSLLLQGSNLEGMRCISGSILTGRDVGANGYLRFFDSQITVIPTGGERELLGWAVPGFGKYTFSKTFASAFLPQTEVSLNTDENGSHRAIVLNDVYDHYTTIDVMTFFLLRSVISGDVEEAEKLGILECDEEDFALATFACPSKTDVGTIIRQGLENIEREG